MNVNLIEDIYNSNKEFKLNKLDIHKVLIEIEKVKINNYIYPEHIKNKTELNYITIYQTLAHLINLNFISRCFEIHCDKCEKDSKEIYDSLCNFPKEKCCNNCNNKLNAFKDVVIIYKKVKEI